ncbi:hypothetical protein Van01_42750 [Micromonospora andamanensis]|uniref:Uncharacterized protein n=1 Tax=Micromonospora andamanensis TaxID=1287068 RepID=A0ABQ4HZY1_9ACTN|nr:hypothetical protein Van01_42750 [Micromonospora andamanensis]
MPEDEGEAPVRYLVGRPDVQVAVEILTEQCVVDRRAVRLGVPDEVVDGEDPVRAPLLVERPGQGGQVLVAGFQLLGPLRVPQAGEVRTFPERREDEAGRPGGQPFAGVPVGFDRGGAVGGRYRSGQERRDGTEHPGHVKGTATNDCHRTHPSVPCCRMVIVEVR